MENGVLYESAGRTDVFFTRFQVRNESGSDIGVDLGGGDTRIRPIQYSGIDAPEMSVINIISPTAPVVSDSLAEAEASAWAGGALFTIGPGDPIEYYGEFDGSGREEIDALGCRWLMIAYGGWITVTDGSATEVVAPEGGFVYIPARFPVTWAGMPTE